MTNLTIECNYNIAFEAPFQIESFVQKICTLLSLKDGSLELTFTDNPHIRDMNNTHLNHDYDTDIITFNLSDIPECPMGDIYISIDQAHINAKEHNATFEFELKNLIVHGILHVLGHEDYTPEQRQAMFDEQLRLITLATDA